MKNRLIAVLLSIVIVLTLAPALAYADVNDDPYGSDIFNGSSVDDDTDPYGEDIFGDPTQGHISSHNVTSYPAKASTCEVQGNQAYWYCQECNKYFSDADCTNEISENSWVLPLASHQPELKNAKDATCTENGYTGDLICKICGKKIESGEPIAKLGHDLTVTPAKAATETEDGNTAYWHCSRCNKYFGDAEGKNEIQKDSWIIPATGSNPNDDNDPYGEDIFGDPTQGHISSHNVTSYPAKASTCEVQGNQAYWYCQECNKYFSDADCTNEISANSWVLPLASHDTELKNAKAATCTENGYSGDYVCKNCGNTIKSGSVIAAKGHKLVSVPAKAATCTTAGNIAYFYCTTCGKHYPDATATNEIVDGSWEIPATGHRNVTHTAAKSGTCYVAGNYEYWHCSDCGKYYKDSQCTKEYGENEWIDYASGHNLTKHNAVASTCTKQGNTEYYNCTLCGKYFSDATATNEIAENSWISPLAPHDTELKNAKEATCTENGYTGDEVCKNCGNTIKSGSVIVAQGHKLVSVPEKEATCTTAGNIAYYYCTTCGKYFPDATATNEIVDGSWEIPAKAHKIVAVIAKASTCTTAGNSAYWYCTTCGKYFSDATAKTEIAENSWILPLASHDTVIKNAKGATCTEKGYTGDKVCTNCGKTISYGSEIAAKGHNFVQTGYKAATVTNTGLITYTCSNCGAKKTTTIAKLDESKPLSPANAPSVAEAEKTIYASKVDEAPAGSLFNLLQLRSSKTTKNSITLKWTKVKGATGYIIYGSPCGSKYKKLKTLSGSKASITLKKLKKGKYYKFFIVATAKYKGKTKVIATSKTVHIATKGGKIGNYKSVKLINVKKNKVTIKNGKNFTIKAKAIVQSKKLKVRKHRNLSYESTNSRVAKVNKNGKITAKKKGTCFVYVYDQSGNFAKIKVTVK